MFAVDTPSSMNGGVSRDQIFYAYIEKGETVYFGSSVKNSLSKDKKTEIGEAEIRAASVDDFIKYKFTVPSTYLDLMTGVSGNPSYMSKNSTGGNIYRFDSDGTIGYIGTRAQEKAGPRFGSNTSGYTPFAFTAPQTAVYRFDFNGNVHDAGEGISTHTRTTHMTLPSGVTESQLNKSMYEADDEFASAVPDTSSALAAWDITVTKDGKAQKGRVWTEALIGVFGSCEGKGIKVFNGQFYVLTKDGYRYFVDLNGMDPNSFAFFANSRGLVFDPTSHNIRNNYQYTIFGTDQAGNEVEIPINADTDEDAYSKETNELISTMKSYIGNSIYKSVKDYQFNSAGMQYFNEGYGVDYHRPDEVNNASKNDYTHKIFFNDPSDAIYESGLVERPSQPDLSDASVYFVPKYESDEEEHPGVGIASFGGTFYIKGSELEAFNITLKLSGTLDDDGNPMGLTDWKRSVNTGTIPWSSIPQKAREEILLQEQARNPKAKESDLADCAFYSVAWNGRDGSGRVVPSGTYSQDDFIEILPRLGEVHFPVGDDEYNPGGIRIQSLDAGVEEGKPDTADTNSWVIYYDHTAVDGYKYAETSDMNEKNRTSYASSTDSKYSNKSLALYGKYTTFLTNIAGVPQLINGSSTAAWQGAAGGLDMLADTASLNGDPVITKPDATEGVNSYEGASAFSDKIKQTDGSVSTGDKSMLDFWAYVPSEAKYTPVTFELTDARSVITVKKEWYKNGAQDAGMAEDGDSGAIMQLYETDGADGWKTSGSPVLLNAANGWTHDWTITAETTESSGTGGTSSASKSLFDSYKVEETAVVTRDGQIVITNKNGAGSGGDYSVAYTSEEAPPEILRDERVDSSGHKIVRTTTIYRGTVTVANSTKTADITVSKEWRNMDQEADRPELTFKLYRKTAEGGRETAGTVVLPYDGKWSYTWKDVPGTASEYIVEESPVSDSRYDPDDLYTESTSSTTGSGTSGGTAAWEFTNYYRTAEVRVTKTFSGCPASVTDSVESVSVTLYRNGKQEGAPKALNAANSWTASWTGLPGEPEEYEVRETAVTSKDGRADLSLFLPDVTYQDTRTEGADLGWLRSATIDNTARKTKLSVRKEWDLQGSGAELPDSITALLYRNGTLFDTADLAEANGWACEWEYLPGEFSEYTIEEEMGDGQSARFFSEVPDKGTLDAGSTGTDWSGSWTIKNTYRHEYERTSGWLRITKEVENADETEREYAFLVKKLRMDGTALSGVELHDAHGKVGAVAEGDVIWIGAGETASIRLPAGAEYEILEEYVNGYVTRTEASASVSAASLDGEERIADLVILPNGVAEEGANGKSTLSSATATGKATGNTARSSRRVKSSSPIAGNKLTREPADGRSSSSAVTGTSGDGITDRPSSFFSTLRVHPEADDGSIDFNVSIAGNTPDDRTVAGMIGLDISEGDEYDYTYINTKVAPSEGSLTVRKLASGDGTDPDDVFTFKLNLTDPMSLGDIPGSYDYDITAIDTGIGLPGGRIHSGETFTLKAGWQITIKNIPADARYHVSETDGSGYELAWQSAAEGIIPDGDSAYALFVNRKDAPYSPGPEPPSAKPGNLLLRKTIAGGGADPLRQFEFKVTFDGQPADAEYPYIGTGGAAGGKLTNGGSILLRGGEAALITGIPAGTAYHAEEVSAAGYEVTSQNASGTIPDGSRAYAAVAAFTNYRAGTGEEPDVPQRNGTLTVVKTVSGNETITGPFTFTAAFDPEVGADLSGLSYTGDYTEASVNPDYPTRVRFTLEDGQYITFTGVPFGTSYSVSETSAGLDGSLAMSTGDTGVISDRNAAALASFVNFKGDPVFLPEIRLTKSMTRDGEKLPDTGAEARSGDVVTYVLRAENIGIGTAVDIDVKDSAPEGSVYDLELIEASVGAEDSGVTWSIENGEVTWHIPRLAAGGSTEVRFSVRVPDMPFDKRDAWDNTASARYPLAESSAGDPEPEAGPGNVYVDALSNLVSLRGSYQEAVIAVTKQINETYGPFGDPTFLFLITNNETGESFTRSITLSEGALSGTEEITVARGYTYRILELNASRYLLSSIVPALNITDTDVAERTARADLTDADRAEAVFYNEITLYEKLSHTDCAVNRIGTGTAPAGDDPGKGDGPDVLPAAAAGYAIIAEPEDGKDAGEGDSPEDGPLLPTRRFPAIPSDAALENGNGSA